MTLPSYIEVQRQELADTPGVQRVFVGRDETFFISGQVSTSIVADELGAELNRQRQGKGLAELSMRLRVVRVLPGTDGGTYFEAYARRPREFGRF